MFMSYLQTDHANRTVEILILLPGPLADLELKDLSVDGRHPLCYLYYLLNSLEALQKTLPHCMQKFTGGNLKQYNKSDSLPQGSFVPTQLNSQVSKCPSSFVLCEPCRVIVSTQYLIHEECLPTKPKINKIMFLSHPTYIAN